MGRFNLAMPARQIPVTRFGGLFTLADPRDLPEGASWLAQDVDFIISGAGLRPGLTPAIGFDGTAGQPQWFAQMLLGAEQSLMAQDTLGSLWSKLLAASGDFSPIYSGILNQARALGFAANLREYICLSNVRTLKSYPAAAGGRRAAGHGPAAAMGRQLPGPHQPDGPRRGTDGDDSREHRHSRRARTFIDHQRRPAGAHGVGGDCLHHRGGAGALG